MTYKIISCRTVSYKPKSLQTALFILIAVFHLQAISEPLFKNSTSWDGGTIAYPAGQAEVTAVMLKVAEGQVTAFHCHPIPTFGYVLNGTLEVETKAGKKLILSKGDPLVEVMRTVHRGKALEGNVDIIVFYAGAVGTPTTVLPHQDSEHEFCNP